MDLYSKISALHDRLQLRWCPAWHDAFRDEALGGYHERLDSTFQPMMTAQRRLLTQCRQLAVYSNSFVIKNKRFKADLNKNFELILARFRDPETGLWAFSLDDRLAVKDRTCDLYALSFVIFSCAHYHWAAADPRAATTARGVAALIDSRFRVTGLPGFAESLDPGGAPVYGERRQNPHMHLLEACLFAHDVWPEPLYETLADEIVRLFYGYFYRPEQNALYEHLNADLEPLPGKSDALEPGHYFEWVWLLKKHAALKNDPAQHDEACAALMNFAHDYGWDDKYDGIYDAVGADGRVIAPGKRIWPLCEALKAYALMLGSGENSASLEARMTQIINILENHYLGRGAWTEWLNRDLTPATDYLPGTTPYHIYFGITETLSILRKLV